MTKSDKATGGAEIMVRRATIADLGALAEFNMGIALKTEARRLDPDVLRAGLARVLGDSSLGFYSVAEIGGEVVGCTLITFEWSDWRNGMIWWIQSVYVAAHARGQGVFSAIHRRLDEESRSIPGVLGFRLYVEEENHRAQEVYRRRGLGRTRYVVFEGLHDESQ
ncbi:MAG TPA: GNAT family N-acetyltransferase [Opitutaceae bacterium]|nr:GNAT family N-acetyltransferase [Opitutaceae bacterium]